MFKKLDKSRTFPEMEKEVLVLWEKNKTFEKSLEQTKAKKPFVFYDGPPFATGLPHYGHLLAGTLKDIVPRYWTMRGRYVERRFGWDCHGLPIEKLVQDELGLKGTPEILNKGVALFNETCRSSVLKYAGAWRTTVTRMGRFVDFNNDYKTMDRTFMESVWWVFKEIWKKGRVYKAHRVMPYSWALTTPLSNFEANANYKDVQDPSITVRFKIKGAENEYFLVWTTTPWTLPSNLALCAGPDIDYVKIRDTAQNAVYYLAEARLATHYKKPGEYEVLSRIKGTALYNMAYEPLFPYFKDHPNAFRVLNDPFVTTEDGTGIVHMAPAYGEDDYRISIKENIEIVDPLDIEANFTGMVPDFSGQHCKAADKAIIHMLKSQGKLVHQSTIVHSYPFCDRSDTPLIYRAIEAWYIRVEDLREKLCASNERIHWVPEYVGSKRFGNWLKEAKDWNISRNRFWGSCIPLWICPACGHVECIGSIKELEALASRTAGDLHKHTLDPITFACTRSGCSGAMRRTPEVFDCWFESGSMPYGQKHYPFENKELFEQGFPADFIAEGLDQTRGWFYTLLVLSTILFEKPAFRNVIVNGLILAEDGKKMSKRLKNYPAPEYVMETYGADALRMYLINSPVVRAEDLRFSEAGVKEILKSVIIPLWNSYNFFIEYAITDGWDPARNTVRSRNELDRWILSMLQSLVKEVNAQMESYNLYKVVPAVVDFIDDLTNWYIRRSRGRFWANVADDPAAKNECHSTLHTVLLTFSKVLAPILPFVSEEMYQNLALKGGPASVHLCEYPMADESHIDPELEERMRLVRAVVGIGNALRAKHNIKNRQPLPLATVVMGQREQSMVRHYEQLIREELNIKRIDWANDATAIVSLTVKPNYRLLGKKFGPRMKEAAVAIAALEPARVTELANGTPVSILGVAVEPGEVVVERTSLTSGAIESRDAITVALDITISEELFAESLALEFKNRVNTMRKEIGLDKEDRIRLHFETADAALAAAIGVRYRELVLSETLATFLDAKIPGSVQEKKEYIINDAPVKIGIEKAQK
ncbi:MAG: isoleucine--tRNA ligase [Candidatus Raymondbacteria bacterium RifOxyB12_full_50_8]|uniref:Isoleucine--tRNA ligase n=1 Tax=Candidatus Raymondbacteria bacterium RIFOXYD12_FULL_49_13 TaxID=1817890 RepID=A0A1F7F6D5_UNCRA|nr:MAG: isoleucine--tRNA ligase [Candidatus Raymondbacteria bacterium RIFOXYA2_FULL_49_16]OGJ96042.1 MAG: isoleucine--tRNA ligase [Candidatus Raymondbacteria bacterium RifOxyB12_full_50_8]OGK02230.1 MAG: isoleucine--tRNA ligase [Candidatus Raymondbacteria bacterium RIFOXYD12_FULL_49_13]OGP45157.1 MAG: isoleucine--tRNA ligase [Candidatus Raymondbacteria bacterium RIFOXYB2_FULL_49_35]